MGKFFIAIAEAIVLVGVSAGIGFYANGVLEKKGIPISLQRFTAKPVPGVIEASDASGGQKESTNDRSADAESSKEATPSDPKASNMTEGPISSPAPAGSAFHLDHEFGVITTEEMHDLIHDPMTEAGFNIIVDARDEVAFSEGHIPGAIQCDPAYAGEKAGEIAEQAMSSGATRIVVYCNGGDCTDSIDVCRHLVNYLGQEDLIYLYEGGWAEWSKAGHEVEY